MGGLSKYRDFSIKRLHELETEMKQIPALEGPLKNLAVYVCGSYARLEAHERTDLDPFFVNVTMGADEETSLTSNSSQKLPATVKRTDEIKFFADFIRDLESLRFPALTRDGEYLKVHELQDIRETLGGPRDDYENRFTARMLLLLESRPLSQNGAYDKLVQRVIEFYFRDYHDHEKDFRAIFLLNDIVRYWKTMCLNYEHKREFKQLQNIRDEQEQADTKAKIHLKNLKLKFSRLMICYSMMIPLVSRKTHAPGDIAKLVAMTPTERIEALDTRSEKQSGRVLKRYIDFLDLVAREDILTKIADREFRNKQFDLARQFRDEVYGLLEDNADQSTWRYLII